jgi:endoglucanase
MRLKPIVTLFLLTLIEVGCAAQDWPPLWKSYVAGFMDNQVRVIDHDAGDRTTSEGQAYGMFFALVANDRSRFDGLLRWTEQNLAANDLTAHLPAWLWGRGPNNQWGVLDGNSAADADIWMAYTLLEAGKAWNETRYTQLGSALAQRIGAEEVVQVPGLGTTIIPGRSGFHHDDSYRLNASYVPLQLILRLSQLLPDGPWRQVAATVPALVSDSAPHGFAADWIEFKSGAGFQPSAIGSYDAIRVYLWAGMLDAATPQRDGIVKSLSGMAKYLRADAVPPAKVRADGSIEDPKGPVGFSAALLPYAEALGENHIRDQQMSRMRSEFKSQTGLYGSPAKYYDQNLAMFGLGWRERQFWFDSQGALRLTWKRD